MAVMDAQSATAQFAGVLARLRSMLGDEGPSEASVTRRLAGTIFVIRVFSAALDTVPKPASVGDPNPLTIRDVKREGKSTVLIDVLSPDARTVNLFVEGPTPDWALPVPKLVEHGPPGIKRFSFELDGVPPGVNPEGAALKLTLVGGDRSYEFNINLY